MKLPPSIEAILYSKRLWGTPKAYVAAIAHEACRLQLEADKRFLGWDIFASSLVVEKPE